MDRVGVIQVLSRIARKPAADIHDHASLASLGLSTSLGLSLLRSNLEGSSGTRLGPFVPQLEVGELVTLVNGAASVANGAIAASDLGNALVPAATAPPSDAVMLEESHVELGLGLGLDMQDVEAMPVASDYRSHEFYRTHFHPSELATAMLRPDPREHLCGVFCAKEAAKKSHPELLDLHMEAFIVTHAASGRPSLRLAEGQPLAQRFRFTLSISHARGMAVAACITRWRVP
jgi:holo-[acyl-carrier protein] synthase